MPSIYWFPHIVETRSSEDDPPRPHETGQGEQPEEQPVKHHGHVLPVLHHLQDHHPDWSGITITHLIVLVIVSDMLGYELHSLQGILHLWAKAL